MSSIATSARATPARRRPASGGEAPSPRGAAFVGGVLGLAAALVGVRIGALGSGPMLSSLLVVLAAATAVLVVGGRELLRTRLGTIDLAMVGYIVVRTAVEAVNAVELQHAAYSAIALDPTIMYLAFLAARWVGTSTVGLIALLRGIAAPIFFVAPLAVAQVLKVPGVGEFLIAYTSSGGFERRFTLGYELRGTSTIGHHTALGGYLVVLAAVACTDLLLSRRLKRSTAFPLLALGLIIVAQFTTLTFATIGATAVVIIATLVKLGVRPGVLVASAVSLVAAWSIFGASVEGRVADQTIRKSDEYAWLPSTVAYRAEVWINETIPTILERPMTGWGFDVYTAGEKDWPIIPSRLVWLSPESEYMRTLVSGGWISLIAEVVLLFAALVAISRAARALGGGLGVPALTATVVLLVISAIHSHLTNPGAPLVLWPLIGAVCGYAAARAPVPDADRHESPPRRSARVPHPSVAGAPSTRT